MGINTIEKSSYLKTTTAFRCLRTAPVYMQTPKIFQCVCPLTVVYVAIISRHFKPKFHVPNISTGRTRLNSLSEALSSLTYVRSGG